MSTFLQLVQKTVQKCGIGRNTTITTVVSQSGKALEIVNRVNEAYADILTRHRDWGFLRKSASFVTVAGQAPYTTAQANTTNFEMWERQSFRNYLTASGAASEIEMTYIDHQSWLDTYQFSTNRTAQSRPVDFTITPNQSIGLGPVPLVGYTITADYFSGAVEMTLNTDTPSIPSAYQMAIVYRAMMLYAPSDAATEVYQEGKTEFGKIITRLESAYLPEVTIEGPMV